MSASAVLGRTWGHGRKTQNSGTVINILMPPVHGKRSKITDITVTVGATAHTLTILAPQNFGIITAAALASQAVLQLDADPGLYLTGAWPNGSRTATDGIAANDYCVYETPDGTFVFDTVSSWSASTLQVTMTTNIPTNGVKAGSRFWLLGVTGDINPFTGEAHPIFTLGASQVISLSALTGSLVESPGLYMPLLIQDNNITNADTIEAASGNYGP